MTEQDLIVIEPDFIISKEIPTQFSSKLQEQFIQASSNFTKQTGFAVIIGVIIGQLFGKEVIKRIWSLFSCMQMAILMNQYATISMPAIAKETIKGIEGIIQLSAFDIKKLAEKLKNKNLIAYLEDPKRFISSLNPLLMIVIGVICLGAVVAVVSFLTTKFVN